VAIVATSGFFVHPARCPPQDRDKPRVRPPENHAHSGRRASMTHRSRLRVFELIREIVMT
jgi:hypothetical protein